MIGGGGTVILVGSVVVLAAVALAGNKRWKTTWLVPAHVVISALFVEVSQLGKANLVAAVCILDLV